MKDYQSKEIRNIVIIGHQGSGKTTLTESMLYVAKNISKKGEVDKKNTVSDFLPEEQQRLSSLSTSIIPVEYNGYKLNFLDTPGNDEFVGELNQALSVVKGAVILVDATSGVQVGTERVWKEVRKKKIPTVIFINKMDKENIKFDDLLKEISKYSNFNIILDKFFKLSDEIFFENLKNKNFKELIEICKTIK